MDACLTHAQPLAAPARSIDTQRLLRRVVAVTLFVGLVWRFVRYLGQFPIWGDEAMLLLNILERDYVGLTEHLRFGQVAPLLFLWLEKSAIHAFGASEWSVHLFPLLMGLIGFAVFWRTCRQAFVPKVAGLAIAVFAVAYYPVRHACEVKPYVFDLGFAVLYLSITLAYLRGVMPTRWLIALVAMTPIAVFASYPSVFVAGSVSLVLLPTMRTATWRQRWLYALFNLVMIFSFVVHFGFVGQPQVDVEQAMRDREYLQTYWKDAFPPESLLQWPSWLLTDFTGNMLAYPIGAKNGGSTITFLLVLLGSVNLWRSGQRSLLALCWFPFGLNLVASILGKYPFGDSARVTLHLAPFICVLMAHGISLAISAIRSDSRQTEMYLACQALLLVCGVTGIARDLAHPYKTEHDRDVRLLAHDIAANVASGEPVLLSEEQDERLPPEFLCNLRTRHLPVRWQSAGVDADTPSYWLVQWHHYPHSDTPSFAGWRSVASEMRLVPPENDKMPPVYFRWVHFVRE